MKKITVIAAALLLASAGLAFGQVSTLQCIGTESGGGGGACGTAYTYLCTPGITPVTQIAIGTEDPVVAAYKNLCLPPGWTFAIVPVGPADYSGKTAHGVVSAGPTGVCNFRMIFAGPPQAAAFEVGFDHPSPSHDVEWIDDDNAALWAAPVGQGQGPVHSPAVETIPTLSEWGMIGVLVLLLLAGAFFILRRRRTATA